MSQKPDPIAEFFDHVMPMYAVAFIGICMLGGVALGLGAVVRVIWWAVS